MSKLLTTTEVARALGTSEAKARKAMDASVHCQRPGHFRVYPEDKLQLLRKAITRNKPGRPKGKVA